MDSVSAAYGTALQGLAWASLSKTERSEIVKSLRLWKLPRVCYMRNKDKRLRFPRITNALTGYICLTGCNFPSSPHFPWQLAIGSLGSLYFKLNYCDILRSHDHFTSKCLNIQIILMVKEAAEFKECFFKSGSAGNHRRILKNQAQKCQEQIQIWNRPSVTGRRNCSSWSPGAEAGVLRCSSFPRKGCWYLTRQPVRLPAHVSLGVLPLYGPRWWTSSWHGWYAHVTGDLVWFGILLGVIIYWQTLQVYTACCDGRW